MDFYYFVQEKRILLSDILILQKGWGMLGKFIYIYMKGEFCNRDNFIYVKFKVYVINYCQLLYFMKKIWQKGMFYYIME